MKIAENDENKRHTPTKRARKRLRYDPKSYNDLMSYKIHKIWKSKVIESNDRKSSLGRDWE